MASSIVNPTGDGVSDAGWSNKPLNGVIEEPVSIPVIDSGIWPSLGQSSSSGSLQEVSGNSSNKPAAIVNDEITAITTVNNVAPSGQRPTKRAGGSSGAYVASNGIVTMRTPPSYEASHITSGKPVAVDSNPKDETSKESTRGNDQHSQRYSYRRGDNGGYHPRGGNRDWNQNRNGQQHRDGYRRGGYVRPSVHNAPPPVVPPMHMPMSPFANNLIYPDAGSAMYYFPAPAQPMVPGPMFFPFMDPLLHSNILNQINYYFSNENLVKDPFLRRSMDEQGWVSANLIAGFKKVSSMTDDVQLILHVMRSSVLVEVQGDKMRRRNDWMKWLLPAVAQDSLASQLQGIGLSSSRSSSSGELQHGSSSRSSSSGELQEGGGRERAAVVQVNTWE